MAVRLFKFNILLVYLKIASLQYNFDYQITQSHRIITTRHRDKTWTKQYPKLSLCRS